MDKHIPYKKQKTFEERQEEAAAVLSRHPDKLAVVLERVRGEKMLPVLDPCVFTIGRGTKFAELMMRIRKRLQLNNRQTFYLIVNPEGSKPLMPANTDEVDEYHNQYKEKDGFLYIAYGSQEVYG